MPRISHVCVTSSLALPLCLLLSACGEGTTSVANIPPPPVTPTPAPAPTPTPTPTPTPAFVTKVSVLDSPATRRGSYDVIGLLRTNGSISSRPVVPGEFTMSSGKYFDDDPFQYYLSGPAAILPAGATSIGADQASIGVDQPFLSWTFPSRSFSNQPLGQWCCQYLGDHLTVFTKAADGTETKILSTDMTHGSSDRHFGTTSNVGANLDYDIGYSYVAMGEWSWGTVGVGTGDLLFVEGNLTPPSGIPASGKATYDARTFALLSSNLTPGIPFTLTADFGLRSIAAVIDQDYRYQPNGDLLDYPAPGIHVSGSATFNNEGLFGIPLTGTVNYTGAYPLNTPQTPASQPVTGSMNGAFFGPNAQQVGGTFSLQNATGSTLLQDAFVGQQRP